MNFHPIVVHFPIALLLVGFIFSTLVIMCRKCNKSECSVDSFKPSCLQFTAYWLLLLGTLGSVAALLTGQLFTAPMVGPLGDLRETHQMLAIATMVVSLITSAVYTYYIYKAPLKQVLVIGYVLYLVCAILVAVTGHYGGQIVYMFR